MSGPIVLSGTGWRLRVGESWPKGRDARRNRKTGAAGEPLYCRVSLRNCRSICMPSAPSIRMKSENDRSSSLSRCAKSFPCAPHAAGKLLLGDLQFAAPFAQRVAVIPHHRPFLRLPAFRSRPASFSCGTGQIPAAAFCRSAPRVRGLFVFPFSIFVSDGRFCALSSAIAGSLPCCDGKNIPFPEPRNADRAPTLRRGVIPMTERSRVFPEVMPPHVAARGVARTVSAAGSRNGGAPNGPIAAFDRTKSRE